MLNAGVIIGLRLILLVGRRICISPTYTVLFGVGLGLCLILGVVLGLHLPIGLDVGVKIYDT